MPLPVDDVHIQQDISFSSASGGVLPAIRPLSWQRASTTDPLNARNKRRVGAGVYTGRGSRDGPRPFTTLPIEKNMAGRDTGVSCVSDSFGHGSSSPSPLFSDLPLFSAEDLVHLVVPPTMLPEEFFLSRKHTIRNSNTSAERWKAQKEIVWGMHQFGTQRAAGRHEVAMVSSWFEENCRAELLPPDPIAAIYQLIEVHSYAFHELLRHVTMHCAERGRLLATVWVGFGGLMKELLTKIGEQNATLHDHVSEVADENSELARKLVVEPGSELQIVELRRKNVKLEVDVERLNEELAAQRKLTLRWLPNVEQ